MLKVLISKSYKRPVSSRRVEVMFLTGPVAFVVFDDPPEVVGLVSSNLTRHPNFASWREAHAWACHQAENDGWYIV